MLQTIKQTSSFQLIQNEVTGQTQIKKRKSFLASIWSTSKYAKLEIELTSDMTDKEFNQYCEIQIN